MTLSSARPFLSIHTDMDKDIDAQKKHNAVSHKIVLTPHYNKAKCNEEPPSWQWYWQCALFQDFQLKVCGGGGKMFPPLGLKSRLTLPWRLVCASTFLNKLTTILNNFLAYNKLVDFFSTLSLKACGGCGIFPL